VWFTGWKSIASERLSRVLKTDVGRGPSWYVSVLGKCASGMGPMAAFKPSDGAMEGRQGCLEMLAQCGSANASIEQHLKVNRRK
jgi:hypothetical protein